MTREIRSIDDLTPDAKNANRGTERGRYMLEQSLRETGAGRSIVVDAEGRVIAGNKTLEVAEALGLPIEVVRTDGTRLVVVQRDDLDLVGDGDRARRLAYFDNRSGQIGLEWDAAQMVADLEAGLNLDDMFKGEELAAILEAAADLLIPGEPPEPQIDKADELRQQWQTERGQVWEIPSKTVRGKCHRVMCGDSTSAEDVGRLMEGEKAGAVVTDPPYGIGREGIANDDPEGLRTLYDGCLAAMPVTDAVVIAFQSPRLFWVWVDAVRDAGHKVERMLWWCEVADANPWRGFRMQGEAILLSSIGAPMWDESRCDPDTFDDPNPSRDGHPTQKPVTLLEKLTRHTQGNVFDPFLGSGTTMVAAEQTGRLCYGMEIESKYVAVTLQRLADMGLEPRLIAGD